jgi:nitroimidazol reductase NimA-like FMN-containing flavoprotein (pyridoxamine 5'-phosphate oxidase superfamily)
VETPEEIAERILAANLYMTLATADGSGVPWASPVWYAPSPDRTELYWVSRPGTRHSRNLAVRPELAIVIFDSTVPVYTGQAVYNDAVGAIVPDEELESAMGVFAERSREEGEEWTVAEVQEPAELRLYRAVVCERWILDPDPDAGDRRVPVRLG